LKIAAIEALSYDQFFEMFGMDGFAAIAESTGISAAALGESAQDMGPAN
jgi:hypothetical protein